MFDSHRWDTLPLEAYILVRDPDKRVNKIKEAWNSMLGDGSYSHFIDEIEFGRLGN